MKNKKTITVVKASGAIEPFSEKKVLGSIRRAGISKPMQAMVLAHVKKRVYDRISTKEIYRHILEFLNSSPQTYSSGRYRLRQAIMELGPTGFPFEKYIGEILKHYGYSVETGVIVSGSCVDHEVDVVAEKDDQHFMIECKYHNQPGVHSDVKVALYIKARFDDIAVAWQKKPGHEKKFHQAWLVTNTKLTFEAIKYGECAGMKLVGWSYPKKGCLQDLIEDTGLHPITCLTTLTHQQKNLLLKQNVILCKQLMTDQSAMKAAGVSQRQMQEILKEIGVICHK